VSFTLLHYSDLVALPVGQTAPSVTQISMTNCEHYGAFDQAISFTHHAELSPSD